MKRAEVVLTGGYQSYIELQEFIELFAEESGYDRQFTDTLQLTLKEAYVNAVRHGNREKDGLSVTCSLTAGENRLQAAIHDNGSGFDPDELPDPSENGALMKLSGRGIHIIRNFADISVKRHDGKGATLFLRYLIP
ncbi:MAG: ATP-binding protein [Chlorobium sp.]|nr:MAG: ATP-binding protein [Chlorobium sp.]